MNKIICPKCGMHVPATEALAVHWDVECTGMKAENAGSDISRDPLTYWKNYLGSPNSLTRAQEQILNLIKAQAAEEDEPETSIKEQIADEAKRIVSGARRTAYGTPEDSFERIARFWTAYFANTNRPIEVTAEDVSPMMRLMKEARLCETPGHLDSHIDLVGYALTGAEVNGVEFSS